MKKVLFTICLIAILATVLCACGENGDTAPAGTDGCAHEWVAATWDKAEYCSKCGETRGNALLNSEEQIIYSSIKTSLTYFGDPGAVRLIDVKKGTPAGEGSYEMYYLKMSAKNAYGSSVTAYYTIRTAESYTISGLGKNQTLQESSSYGFDYVASRCYGIGVDKINSCLATYVQSMGW